MLSTTVVVWKEDVYKRQHYMLSHPETQTPDPEFDSWCDRIANAISAADKAF